MSVGSVPPGIAAPPQALPVSGKRVEVSLGTNSGGPGWDTHSNNFNTVQQLSTVLDNGWATLMKELDDSRYMEWFAQSMKTELEQLRLRVVDVDCFYVGDGRHHGDYPIHTDSTDQGTGVLAFIRLKKKWAILLLIDYNLILTGKKSRMFHIIFSLHFLEVYLWERAQLILPKQTD